MKIIPKNTSILELALVTQRYLGHALTYAISTNGNKDHLIEMYGKIMLK
jgi:hypothetical protein